jgi:DnaK suppressor protein
VDEARARELIAAERERIEASLRDLTGEVTDDTDLENQQTGEADSGSQLASEMVDDALIANLRARLDAVARAEERIEAGTYGRSIESGDPIPDDRLEAEPLAELTIEEQRRAEAGR